MKSRICIVGAGGHASLVADAIEEQGQYEIAGLVDDFRPVGPSSLGYPILGPLRDLEQLSHQHRLDTCALGIGDNWARGCLTESVRKHAPKLQFPAIVHPRAYIARRTQISEGCVLLAGSIVNPGTVLESFCFLGTRSSVDHDSSIGSFASIGPGVTTGGNVQVGQFTACGLGANLIHGIRIGDHSVVGAGALVLHSVPERVVVYGIPARVIRTREIGEKYL